MESRSVKQLLPEVAGNGKERVKEADDVKLDVAEDTDMVEMEGEHDAGARMTTGCRSSEHDRVYEYGQGKEKLKEADGVKLDVPEDTALAAQTLNAASYAESSTAAQSRLTKGKGEIESLSQEGDRIFKHARSLVEKVKEKCFMHKVHSGLRVPLSAKHYRPVVLSIGPYHHGDPSVQDMEKHKVHYMQVLLDRQEEESMAKYIKALRNEKGESQALDCYVDTFKMNADSFEQTTEEGNFVPLMLGYFKFNGIQIPSHDGLTTLLDDIPHLLGLVYEALVSCKNEFSVPETAVQLNTRWKSLKSIIWTGLVRLIEKALLLKTAQQPSTERRSCEFIRTAVALDQVGVTFLEAQEDEAAFYDIRFSHGVLSIPRLVVDDNTKSFFRNLVAYEQYSEKNRLHRIVDYMHVMDCLINTGKDVELLRHCGIIDNRIGDDENVSAMFNYLCSNVSFDQDQFFYSKMFKDVNEFCKDRRNVWMAKLKNEYFGSPWSVISFLAAVLLLLLATLQTGYTVASYYK